MSTDERTAVPQVSRRLRWLNSLSTDAHFWVPIFVLVGGLALLRWIS